MTSQIKQPSIEELASKIDYAHRSSLKPYDDDKRLWILVVDEELKLARVAHAAIHDVELFWGWVKSHKVFVHSTLKTIIEEDFNCIYFVDAYLLKPWQE